MLRLYTILIVLSLFSCSENKSAKHNLSSLSVHKYSKAEMDEDFELLINSLKEAHTGIYWYNTPQEFDALVNKQRLKIKDSLNAFEFYAITAPVVAFTKEDHCDIALSEGATAFLEKKGKFLPIAIMNLEGKPYIINNPDTSANIKGWQLLKINNVKIEDIYKSIFSTIGSDGFIEISKYRALDAHRLAVEYAKNISQPDAFTITALNPKTGETKDYTLNPVTYDALKEITKKLVKEKIVRQADIPAGLEITNTTAILTINTFFDDIYKEADMDFKTFINRSFAAIREKNIKNLIIDIRENGGGTEGNEDFLFAFLTDKPYKKYKYVQVSALSYSFYRYTDYSDKEDYKDLEADLAKEHYKATDGRFLRKSGVEQQTPLQPNPFLGRTYVLTSGWTYSGGAEFSSLMKAHTDAVFIGEEVGGGFYGNTSGYGFTLTLPNSGLVIDVPLLKFVLDVSADIPKGRGVLPDYPISPSVQEFLQGKDIEMEFAKKLAARN